MAANENQNPPIQDAQPEAPAPQFALAPTLHPQQDNFIDYGTKEGQKIFDVISAALGIENKFDGKSSEINIFKQVLSERADFSGWSQGNNDIINIATGNGNETKNLLDNYGVITKEMITTWAQNNIVNQQSRAAQNNYAMYKCLSESISENLKNAIVTKGVNCTVGNTKIAALLFKAIMDESEINTVATVSTIQLQLSRLHEIITGGEISGDITKFNQYVKDKIRELSCRGATFSGLILNLFHAYKSVSDSDFTTYIGTKETAFLHGELELTEDKLMSIAETDYKIRVEKGTWGQLSAEQQQIVALSAQISQFKKSKKNKSKKSGSKTEDDETTQDDTKGKKKKSKKDKAKKGNDEKWAWKKVPPINGETTKTFEDKTYHWCPKHKAWTLHKPSECRLKDPSDNEGKDDKNFTFASASATIEEESPE